MKKPKGKFVMNVWRNGKVMIVGRDPVSQLYRAVNRYVKSKGGGIVVIGGIQVIENLPGDRSGTFRIAVKCLGRKPEYAEAK